MGSMIETLREIYTSIELIYLDVSRITASIINNAAGKDANEWADFLTDIIAVSAALGALALPISLNVIEATRSRYKSPSILEIYSEISKTNPKKLNKRIFTYLVLAIIIKLTLILKITSAAFLLPPICIMAIVFCGTISDLYRHLQFTYQLMSEIESVKNELITKINDYLKTDKKEIKLFEKLKLTPLNKFNKNQKKSQNEDKINYTIGAIIELETYEICSNSTKRGISKDLSKTIYKELDNLKTEKSINFITKIIESFPSMMTEIENQREQDIYQSVTGFYLHILAKSIFKNKSFTKYLEEPRRISNFLEKKYPPSGRPCQTGQIFVSCSYNSEDVDINLYTELFKHFKDLGRAAVQNAPECIPDLLRNTTQIIRHIDIHENGAWELARHIPELWRYPGLTELSRHIDLNIQGVATYDDLKSSIHNNYIQEIKDYLKNNTPENTLEKNLETVEKEIKNILNASAMREFSTAINVETLKILARAFQKSPHTLIESRELINPAGSNITNIGLSLTPSSIQACTRAFIIEKNFSYDFSFDEVQEFKIIDVIAALMMYEIWRIKFLDKSNQNSTDKRIPIELPNATLREFKSASQRTHALHQSFNKILENNKFIESTHILKNDKDFLLAYCELFCRELKESLDSSFERQLLDQKLDELTLLRFQKEILKDISDQVPKLPLFKRLKIGKATPHYHSIKYPREAFLSGTDTHYIFNGNGARSIREYHDWLCMKIMSENIMEVSTTLPIPVGELILITQDAVIHLVKIGFSTKDNKLIWPNGKELLCHRVHYNNGQFYQIMAGETRIQASFSNGIENYPIEITHEDEGGLVNHKIKFNLSLISNPTTRTVEELGV